MTLAIGNKSFYNRGTASNPIYHLSDEATVLNERISATSGWVEEGSAWAEYVFNHNLGTDNYIAQAFAATDQYGTNCIELQAKEYYDTNGVLFTVGAQLVKPTANSVSLKMADQASWSSPWSTYKYIKISVVSMQDIWSSGWVDTDGTTALARWQTLSFRHNINSSNLIAQAWIAKDSSGREGVQLQSYEIQNTVSNIIPRGGFVTRLEELYVDVYLRASAYSLINTINWPVGYGGDSSAEPYFAPFGPYYANEDGSNGQYLENTYTHLKVCVI